MLVEIMEMKWDGMRTLQKGRRFMLTLEKSRTQLINLIIVKTKVEQEFLGFQYSRAVNFCMIMDILAMKNLTLKCIGQMMKVKYSY